LFNRFKLFWSQHETSLLLGIFLIGLAVRLGLIFTVDEPIDRDAKEYYAIAQNLIAGNGFSINGIEPTARRSPGYPFFLAGLMAIFGSTPRLIYIAQALINLLTIFLIFQALQYLNIKKHLRLIICLLFCFSSSFIYVNVLYAEVLTMLVVALILFFALHPFLSDRSGLQALLIGLAIGVLIYLRPTFLYLPVFMLAGSLILKAFNRQFPVRNYLAITGLALLILAPWTLRNYIVFRQFIPLVSAGGGELWSANFEIDQRVVWHSVTDIQQYENERTISHAHQKALINQYQQQYHLNTAEELNRFLAKQARSIIIQHPFRYALLCLNRTLIFWFSPPIGSTTLKSISPAIFLFFLLVKYALTILGIVGLWYWARDNFSGALVILMIVVYLTLLHAATHAIQRYFLPLIPVMYLALGYFLNRTISLISPNRPLRQLNN
jgi:hypothetical protein